MLPTNERIAFYQILYIYVMYVIVRKNNNKNAQLQRSLPICHLSKIHSQNFNQLLICFFVNFLHIFLHFFSLRREQMKKYVTRKYSATSFKIRMKCPHFFPSLDPTIPLVLVTKYLQNQ